MNVPLLPLLPVIYEKYGMIVLSKKGEQMGGALLERHQIIEDFLKLLGNTRSLLEETEKIEHTISGETLQCMADFVEFCRNRPQIIQEFDTYRKTKREPR